MKAVINFLYRGIVTYWVYSDGKSWSGLKPTLLIYSVICCIVGARYGDLLTLSWGEVIAVILFLIQFSLTRGYRIGEKPTESEWQKSERWMNTPINLFNFITGFVGNLVVGYAIIELNGSGRGWAAILTFLFLLVRDSLSDKMKTESQRWWDLGSTIGGIVAGSLLLLFTY